MATNVSGNKMSFRVISFLGLLSIAGCGDPETSRLAVGSKAMVVSADKERSQDEVYLLGKNGQDVLPLGTHVTVVDDRDKPGEKTSYRKVHVHVEDGFARGKSGNVFRSELVPE